MTDRPFRSTDSHVVQAVEAACHASANPLVSKRRRFGRISVRINKIVTVLANQLELIVKGHGKWLSDGWILRGP